MEGQPDLTLLSRQIPRLSFVYPPPHSHVCGTACYGFVIVYISASLNLSDFENFSFESDVVFYRKLFNHLAEIHLVMVNVMRYELHKAPIKTISVFGLMLFNKLASLEATLVRNYD